MNDLALVGFSIFSAIPAVFLLMLILHWLGVRFSSPRREKPEKKNLQVIQSVTQPSETQRNQRPASMDVKTQPARKAPAHPEPPAHPLHFYEPNPGANVIDGHWVD